MVILGAEIVTMNQNDDIIENGFIEITSGRISRVGTMEQYAAVKSSVTDGDEVIDGTGLTAYPGFIDAHAHVGMWEDSLGFEGDDGNEDTDPSGPHLRAIDAVNPLDRCFSDALAAGVTTVVTGPGSANPVAGQIIAMKTFGRCVDDMLIKEVGMKFALGENPKTSYHAKQQTPVTRMAIAAIIREQLTKAQKYLEQCELAENDSETEKPEFDIKCESLIPLLKGEIAAYFHAHRTDDIFTALRLSNEFGLKPVIVHGTEGHLIAGDLVASGAPVLCGPIICDRSKPELKALDIKCSGMLTAAGVSTAIITDHPVTPIEYLPISAAVAVKGGMEYYDALKAITKVPADICGISDRVGSIEQGKDADMVLFSEPPLSVSAAPSAVIYGGKLLRRT